VVDFPVGGSRALDQRRGKPEPSPQARFFPRHLSTVGFVVVAGQVQQPVQNQDLDLVGQAVSQAAGIARADLGRNGDVAGSATPTTETRRQREFLKEISPCLCASVVDVAVPRGKRKHVGGPVLSAKAPVQATKLSAGRNEHIHFPADASRTLCPGGKPPERPRAHAPHLAVDNHQI